MARVGLPLVLNAGDAFFSYAESSLLGHYGIAKDATHLSESLEILDDASSALAEALRLESKKEAGVSRADVLATAASKLATLGASESLRRAMLDYALIVAGSDGGSSAGGLNSVLAGVESGLTPEALDKLRDSAAKIAEAYR